MENNTEMKELEKFLASPEAYAGTNDAFVRKIVTDNIDFLKSHTSEAVWKDDVGQFKPNWKYIASELLFNASNPKENKYRSKKFLIFAAALYFLDRRERLN
jgi:hypothetical protein